MKMKILQLIALCSAPFICRSVSAAELTVNAVNHLSLARPAQTIELSLKDLKKLSSDLEADAVIQGRVESPKGENHVLHVKLFWHGKKLKGRWTLVPAHLEGRLGERIGRDKRRARGEIDAADIERQRDRLVFHLPGSHRGGIAQRRRPHRMPRGTQGIIARIRSRTRGRRA